MASCWMLFTKSKIIHYQKIFEGALIGFKQEETEWFTAYGSMNPHNIQSIYQRVSVQWSKRAFSKETHQDEQSV